MSIHAGLSKAFFRFLFSIYESAQSNNERCEVTTSVSRNLCEANISRRTRWYCSIDCLLWAFTYAIHESFNDRGGVDPLGGICLPVVMEGFRSPPPLFQRTWP